MGLFKLPNLKNLFYDVYNGISRGFRDWEYKYFGAPVHEESMFGRVKNYFRRLIGRGTPAVLDFMNLQTHGISGTIKASRLDGRTPAISERDQEAGLPERGALSSTFSNAAAPATNADHVPMPTFAPTFNHLPQQKSAVPTM